MTDAFRLSWALADLDLLATFLVDTLLDVLPDLLVLPRTLGAVYAGRELSGDTTLVSTSAVRSPHRAMSSTVTQYAALPPIRSALFHSPPDTVPPTDELEQLQSELIAFKTKSLERAKKAGDDIRTIEETMRRLKEKEKGKAKALQKAERERQCAYDCSGLYSDAYHVVGFTSYSPAAGPV